MELQEVCSKELYLDIRNALSGLSEQFFSCHYTSIKTSMMTETHEQELEKFCRVCARKLNKGYKHKCSANSNLLESLGIKTSEDLIGVHPPYYCHNCHSTARRLEKNEGADSSLKVHTWTTHGGRCEVCSMASDLHQGGRKKKEPVKRGRLGKESRKGIASRICADAPTSWKSAEPADNSCVQIV